MVNHVSQAIKIISLVIVGGVMGRSSLFGWVDAGHGYSCDHSSDCRQTKGRKQEFDESKHRYRECCKGKCLECEHNDCALDGGHWIDKPNLLWEPGEKYCDRYGNRPKVTTVVRDHVVNEKGSSETTTTFIPHSPTQAPTLNPTNYPTSSPTLSEAQKHEIAINRLRRYCNNIDNITLSDDKLEAILRHHHDDADEALNYLGGHSCSSHKFGMLITAEPTKSPTSPTISPTSEPTASPTASPTFPKDSLNKLRQYCNNFEEIHLSDESLERILRDHAGQVDNALTHLNVKGCKSHLYDLNGLQVPNSQDNYQYETEWMHEIHGHHHHVRKEVGHTMARLKMAKYTHYVPHKHAHSPIPKTFRKEKKFRKEEQFQSGTIHTEDTVSGPREDTSRSREGVIYAIKTKDEDHSYGIRHKDEIEKVAISERR